MANQYNFKNRATLVELMSKVEIKNYAQLSRNAKVSERQIYRLENGLIKNLTLDTLQKIAKALNLSVESLIKAFSPEESVIENEQINDNQPIQAEKQQLTEELNQQLQLATISTLESLLLQLPTITEAVKQNPELPATRLLPLLKPLNQLLSQWGIEAIASVGDIITYNPQEHELMDSENIPENEINEVKVRYVGYRQGEKLLYRAKVSRI